MKTICRALVIALAVMTMLPSAGRAEDRALLPARPPVGMASGILVDLGTGKILWARDDQTPRPPASLTKMLTALIVLERLRLSDRVPITREARFAEGQRIYAEEGWTFSVEELLWGMLLMSGNDAALALAQKASPDGSIEGFVGLMNQRAAELGATTSTFRNPHGLDEPGHLASSRDLVLISTAAMRNKVFAKMVAARSHTIAWGDGSQHTFANINKLLYRYPGAIGIKTAYTTEAGRGLASAVRRDGTTLIAVVLDAPDHYADSMALYDWGFANLPVLEGRPLGIIKPVVTAKDPAGVRVGGLEVVQYEPGASPEDTSSGPLIVPLAALAFAVWAGRFIRRRFARPVESVEDRESPHRWSRIGEPERIDA